VSHEHALPVLHLGTELAGHEGRAVAGQDGVGLADAVHLAEEALLQVEVLRRCFDDHVRFGDGGREITRRLQALRRGGRRGGLDELELDHAAQVRPNPIDDAIEHRFVRVDEADLVAGDGKLLRDPVAHEPRADHGDASNLVLLHTTLLTPARPGLL
jgi:hypothetical protein